MDTEEKNENMALEGGDGDCNISWKEVDGTMSDHVSDQAQAHPSGGCVSSGMMSPLQTIQTVETIVSTNKVSIYSHVEAPAIGMVFKSLEAVETYYKEYAEQEGFGISRVGGYTSKKTKERRGMTWRCECYGQPDMRARREAKKRAKTMDVSGTGGTVNGVVCEDDLARGIRTSKKCDCGAMVYASVNNDGLWVIRKVVLKHDRHEFSPSKAKLVKEYRMKKCTTNVRKKLINYFDEGIPVSQIHACLALENGGVENVPTVKDLQHEVYKERRARLKMAGGDASAMMEYFEKMQADNQNFYHAHRLDDDGRLKDVMWVDARSRAAYEYFGDAVCLDATYLTNEYELPFANIVGVNHHGQSILLGCALVSHEDAETYSWIIRQWLKCMNNKPPQSILTDQAASIRKALAQEMPTARHRWCIWHIMKKFPENLGKCEGYKDFKSPLKAVIYESFTVGEFENRWTQIMQDYKLQENDWLSDLYKERHMWVPAFMKEHFWAGMKTTQRVESINAFFDGFVNRKTKLYEFPEKYTRAMTKRVKDETDADARCSKYVRRLVSGFKIEEFFQKIYTDAKFQEIQTECSKLMYVAHREQRVLEEHVTQYLLEDRVWIVPEGKSEEKITDRRRFYTVTYNASTKEACCDCRKFETFGILCNHQMRILDQHLVFDIPKKYVLDRWRKDIVRKHTRVKVAYHDPTRLVHVKRYNIMMQKFESICEEASTCNELTVDLVIERLTQMSVDVKQSRLAFEKKQEVLPMPNNHLPPSEHGSNTVDVTPASVTKPSGPPTRTSDQTLKDPKTRKKPRGRPKGSRYKSLAEVGYKTSKAPTTQTPTEKSKLPVKRKTRACDDYVDNVVLGNDATDLGFDDDYAGDDLGNDAAELGYDAELGCDAGFDDLIQRNGVEWSIPSDIF